MSKLLNFLGGGVVKQVGDVIDNLSTSEEERLEAKRKMEEVLMQAESQAQEQVTRRWEADMKSDNWLSKNIRPLVLIFLCVSTILLIFIDAGVISFEVKTSWVDLLQLVLMTTIGAYFGGRSIEKVKKKK